MEEQSQMYQFYYYPEHNHQLNYIPVSHKVYQLNYSKKSYTELGNSKTSRVSSISFACLSRCRSKSYIELVAEKSTPLLNGNATLPKKLLSPSRKRILLSVFVVFYIGFLVLGSLTFRTFELDKELEERQAYRDDPNILDDDLEEFIENVIHINGKGVSVLRNATGDLNWSFGQASIFSATVITTIGYGHVTPLSEAGKIFCIIYATVGIPLTLVLISAVVERLLIPTNWILGKLNSKLGHLYQPFNIRLLHLAINELFADNYKLELGNAQVSAVKILEFRLIKPLVTGVSSLQAQQLKQSCLEEQNGCLLIYSYPSYPGASEPSYCIPTHGFVSAGGTHTNSISCLCALENGYSLYGE